MFLTAATVIVAAALNFASRAPQTTAKAEPMPEPPQLATIEATPQAVTLKEFLVDLAPDRTGRVAYMRLQASIKAEPGATAEFARAVDARRDEISERLAFLFRGLSADDFEGEEGMSRVKAEMLRRVNLVIAPASASEVVITDLIIQ
jgi:flagellar FliL protein